MIEKSLIDFERGLKLRKKIFLFGIVGFVFLLPAIFYITTVWETNTFKNLDKESYNSRMFDSFYYAAIMLIILIIIIIPVLFCINKIMNLYLKFLKKLSASDIQKLILLNDKEDFVNKYIPPYIIRSDTVTFFSQFRQNTIRFSEIKKLTVKQSYHIGYSAIITIETFRSTYNYRLSGNPFKVQNLVAEAITFNPKIVNNTDWNI